MTAFIGSEDKFRTQENGTYPTYYRIYNKKKVKLTHQKYVLIPKGG